MSNHHYNKGELVKLYRKNDLKVSKEALEDFSIEEEYEECLKEIERLQNKVEELMTLYTTERNVKEDYRAIINKAKQYVKTCKDNDMGIRYQRIEEILQGSGKE